MSATPTTTINEQQNGWTAVPVDPAKILHGKDFVHAPEPLALKDIAWPQSPVVDKVHQHAKDKLPEKVYNHSMRVYYYGECAGVLRRRRRWSLRSALGARRSAHAPSA